MACSTGGPQRSVTITVAAAASLSSVFPTIASAFERTHPGEHIRFTFGGSNMLALQIQAGAPVDVFVSAAPRWIDVIAKDPGVADRAVLARNRLVVIVPRDNPDHISRFSDLARGRVRLVLAAQGVPAGDYAREALVRAGLRRALSNVVSNEQDVEGVVQKIVSGDADAGIVYKTDVTPPVAADVREIDLPMAVQVVAVYEIAVLHGTHDDAAARAFEAYVLGPGQDALARAGFLRAA
jgi:molybdate transport system substrate-binding protein